MTTQTQQRTAPHEAAGMLDASCDFVSHNPLSTSLAAFGLGLGAGVAAVLLLNGRSSSTVDSGMAHRVGRRILESIGSVVPESMVPESLSRYVKH